MKKNDSIGALWKKEKNKDDKKTEFFSGRIDDVQVFVFENTKKADKNDVDYRIMQSEASEENENETELVPTGELWQRKQQKNSEIYYVGDFRGKDIVVFKNSFKKEDKHPDLVVFTDLPKDIEEKK